MKTKYLLFLLLTGCIDGPKYRYIVSLAPVYKYFESDCEGSLRNKSRRNYFDYDGFEDFITFYRNLVLIVAERYLEIPEIKASYPVGTFARYVVRQFTINELRAITEIKDENKQKEFIYALEQKYRDTVKGSICKCWNNNYTVKKDSNGKFIYSSKNDFTEKIVEENYKYGYLWEASDIRAKE